MPSSMPGEGSETASSAPLEVARVEALDDAGHGVVTVGTRTVRIQRVLTGETVSFRPRPRRSRVIAVDPVAIIEPSAERVTPRCPHFDRCGGCALQHLSHAGQLRLKTERLLSTLEQVGVCLSTLLPPVTSDDWGYRRRARLGVRHVPKKGGALVGFRERHGNRVADMRGCDVLDPRVGTRIQALRDLVTGLTVCNRVPQVEVAVGDNAAAVVFRHLVPFADSDIKALKDFGATHALQVYTQPGAPDSVVRLWPEEPQVLGYELPGNLRLTFGPTDFIQVNAGVNHALVERVLALLAPAPGERVLDLYCGLGNFTLPVAQRGVEVTGLEGDAALVARARANGDANRITGARFETADLNDPAQVGQWLAQAWDAMLFDPPRSGAAEIVAALHPAYPSRIVYVSCNPATLARDAGVLCRAHGYTLAKAALVDMFPHTSHVEAVASFVRD